MWPVKHLPIMITREAMPELDDPNIWEFAIMKERTVFLCFLALAGTCAGCACGDTQSPSATAKEMSLRIIPFGRFGASHSISLMIVGERRAMDVNELSVVDIQAVDRTGRRFPVSLERHPGESSKYGPYASFAFDAKEARGFVAVTGTIAYRTETYVLKARYVQGTSDDTYFWREEQVLLERQ